VKNASIKNSNYKNYNINKQQCSYSKKKKLRYL
jgi:hypothetical protein